MILLKTTVWLPNSGKFGKFGTSTFIGFAAGKFSMVIFKGSSTTIRLKKQAVIKIKEKRKKATLVRVYLNNPERTLPTLMDQLNY